MRIDDKIAAAMDIDADHWRRHANPWSVWTRGAFPRWLRNPGSGEPSATALCAAEQQVLHGSAHPSSIALPMA